jgi:chemotaxis protein histidine kinase CheA
MSLQVEDEFQKELIEVFVQEAQEWLEQIHVALDELQQDPAPDRRLKLAQTIKAGLTNLGGSAATVSLDEIAHATFSALPFTEHLQDPARTLSADDFVALCKQLGQISAGLTRASAVRVAGEGAATSPAQPTPAMTVNDMLAALQTLQANRLKAGAVHRNVIQAVIAQIEGMKRSGVGECKVAFLRDALAQAGTSEEKFLQLVEERIPAVMDAMSQLKTGTAAPGPSSERLKGVVEQVAQLWSTAQQINATHAMTFFRGLHSFLTVIMQGRVVVAAERYEAVEARLAESTNAIESWVENGRADRSAIGALLFG